VGGIVCDHTKAFDCVDHDILISIMENYGVIFKGKVIFHSYIKGRYQRVLVDNKTNHNTTFQTGQGLNMEYNKALY